MRFDNPYSRDLGTFTWAALQAAYANGGGALAALPAGTTAFVSDWGALFTPNAAKTFWRATAPVTLFALAADSTSVVNSTSAFQAMVSYTPPVDLIVPGTHIELPFFFRRSAGTVATRIQVQVGATQIAQSPGTLAANHRGRFALYCQTVNVIRGADGGNALNDQLYSGGSSVALTSATMTGSNAIDIGAILPASTDSSSTYVFQQLQIVLIPPAP